MQRIAKWAALAAAIMLGAAVTASAQTEQSEQAPARGTIVNINAQGESDARPDMATINVGVRTTGRTANQAMTENSRRMNALIGALRRLGIAERDIQTAYVWLSPYYESVDENGEPQSVFYYANNSVRVQIRNIERAGPVLEAAIEAGGNTGYGVSFAHADPTAQLDLARRDAVAEARRRADLYGESLGLRVARVISVTESGAAYAEEGIVITGSRIAGATQTPIVPGEITTRVNTSVSFELR